jgi:hypothetical protein
MGCAMASETENSNGRICTLVYRENENYGSERSSGTALLIAKWEQSGGLSIFANAAWRNFVLPKHQQYIEDLLGDFGERGSEQEGLFQQLCSLHVGPIVSQPVILLKEEPNYIPPPGFIQII